MSTDRAASSRDRDQPTDIIRDLRVKSSDQWPPRRPEMRSWSTNKIKQKRTINKNLHFHIGCVLCGSRVEVVLIIFSALQWAERNIHVLIKYKNLENCILILSPWIDSRLDTLWYKWNQNKHIFFLFWRYVPTRIACLSPKCCYELFHSRCGWYFEGLEVKSHKKSNLKVSRTLFNSY